MMGQPFASENHLGEQLARHLAAPLDLPRLLDEVLRLLHRHFPLEVACVYLPADGSWRLVAGRDAQGRTLPAPPPPRAAAPDDATQTGTLLPLPKAHRQASGGRWLLALGEENEVLALLDLYPSQPLTEQQEMALERLRAPLATALRQSPATLLTPLSDPSDSLARLHQSLAALASAPDVQAALQHVVAFVGASGWAAARVTLHERAHFGVTHAAFVGNVPHETEAGSVWLERLGPSFERFRHDDWYFVPHAERAPNPEGRWHPHDLLYLPLRDHAGHPIGLIVLGDPADGQAPTPERMRPLQLWARSAALLLDAHCLRWESARQLEATRIVQETAALVATSLRVQDVIQHLVNQLAERFGFPLVVVYLREGERFVVAGEHGYPEGTPFERINESVGIMGRAVRTRETQWVPDVATDSDYLMVHPAVVSEIVAPIRRGKEVLGFINVESTAARPLTPQDRELVETLSEQLATALANARLFGELQRHALHLETASEVSRRVTSILNIDQLLAEVVHLIRRNFDYSHVHIFLHDPHTGRWVMREGSGTASRRMKAAHHAFASEEGIVGQVGATGMALLVPDVAQEPRYRPDPHLPDTRAELAVPLRLGAQVFGVLDVHADRRGGLTESDRTLLETLANQIAVALNNAQLFSEIEAQLAERETLYRASYAISAAQEASGVLAALMGPLAPPTLLRAGLLLPARRSATDPGAGLEVAAVWGPSHAPLPTPEKWLPARVLAALRPLATEQLLAVGNLAVDERLAPGLRARLEQGGARSLALLPLRAGSRIVAWLLLLEARPHALEGARLQPYQTLADQAALALERVQLLAQTQQRARRLSALSALSANIVASLDLQQTLEDSVRAMAQLFEVRQSGLLLFEQNNTQGRLMAQYREDGYRHPHEILVPLVGNPLTERLLATRAPVYIRDVESDPLAETIRAGTHPRSYNSLLVVPLLTRNRVIIGSISLDVVAGDEREFEPEEIALAQTMATQIAAAVENARLYEEATHRARAMETASQVGQSLTRVQSEEAMLREVVRLIAERFDCYFVGIFLRDRQHTNRLVLREGSGAMGRALRARRHTLWEGQGLPGYVLATGDGVASNDVSDEPRYLRHALLPATAAEAALPLSLGGELLGVLDVHSAQKGVFDAAVLAVLGSIADQIAIGLQNARLFASQRETLHQLQEVDRLKSEFLANMSHELRTPLNSIIGFSKIILRGIDGPISEQQRQDLTSIFNSGQHLLNLINDILDLSKISAGRMDLTMRPMALIEVIEEVMRALAPQAAEGALRLEQQVEEALPAVLADRVRVRQILFNLVSNGIKFTEQGGVFVSARRVAGAHPGEGRHEGVSDPQGRYVEVAVKDTGIGIKPDEQSIVFEEFRQLGGPSNRRAGGTGLGLAIARRFAELHGGAMWVESRYGVGSTFRFTLPVAPDEALPSPHDHAEPADLVEAGQPGD